MEERRANRPMRKKQAYAGLVDSEPQVVERNTVLILYAPYSGAFGTVLVAFRNGSPSVPINVGYGQHFATFPCDGRIVSTVVLLSGSVNYYTTSRDLVHAFESNAVSAGGSTAIQGVDQVVNVPTSGTYWFYISPPPGTRWRVWGIGSRFTCYTSGNFTITGLNVSIVSEQSAFAGEGPFWALTGLSDTITAAEGDELWVAPSGTTGVYSSAAFDHLIAAIPFEIVVEPSMEIQLEVTVTVNDPGNAVMYLVPLGIQEPL